jgi:hypothetical protein
VRGDVDGSVISRCMPRNTVAPMFSVTNQYEPVSPVYARFSRASVDTPASVISVTWNKPWTTSPSRNNNVQM